MPMASTSEGSQSTIPGLPPQLHSAERGDGRWSKGTRSRSRSPARGFSSATRASSCGRFCARAHETPIKGNGRENSEGGSRGVGQSIARNASARAPLSTVLSTLLREDTRPSGDAWSSPIEGSDRRRFHAVLHLGGIRSRSMRCARLSWLSVGGCRRRAHES